MKIYSLIEIGDFGYITSVSNYTNLDTALKNFQSICDELELERAEKEFIENAADGMIDAAGDTMTTIYLFAKEIT